MIHIDDTYIELQNSYRGRKSKKRYLHEDKEYIFKYGAINNEIYAELISEQIGRQMGIHMAKYRLAELNGVYGVLTNNFLKMNDKILSLDFFKEYINSIVKENNSCINLKNNSVINIVSAASFYDNTIDANMLFLNLATRWVFYGLIVESDKNPTNIAFIKRGSKIFLSPDYDNSNMARLNENVESFMDGIRYGKDIYSYTDNCKQSLTMFNDGEDNFLKEFKRFCDSFPQYAEEIMTRVLNVDIDKAMDTVERQNKIEIPYGVRFWVSKVINARKSDIRNIYEKNVKKIDDDDIKTLL